MFITRIGMFALALMISASAWSLTLQPGNLFRGTILIGKNPGQSCFLEVKNYNSKAGTFHLLMYKESSKNARHFEAHNYNTNLTAIHSYSLKKDANGKTVQTDNEKDVLHVSPNMNPNGNYAIENAVILNDQTVVVNCVKLQRVR